MITEQHQEEGLSRAYVHAVAAHAGFKYEPKGPPDYGVDATIHHVAERNGRHVESGHSLDIQLKATTNWIDSDEAVLYDLEAKTYNDLVERFAEEHGTPMVLVVLCLPKDRDEWLHVSSDQLELRRCCYWCQLSGSPTANTTTKRISLPKENVLGPSELARIMDKVTKGELQ